jgi:tetratricopeptide (TPR) repeat protein
MTRRGRCLMACAAAIVGSALLAGRGAAEDRVTIRPPDSAGLMVVPGDVVQYDDQTLTLRSKSGVAVQTYSTRDVVAVETYRTPGHQAGLEALQAGRTDEALAQFLKGLETEQRRWVREDLLAALIRCHQRQGDLAQAAARFVEIVMAEPRTRHWDLAPLVWGPETISPELQAAARRWLTQKSEGVRLLAASMLLTDPATNTKADMEQLARSSDPYVGSLARAQLWRLTLQTPPGASPQQLDRWRREIERMPESIRGGPWYLLGQAWLQQSGWDEGSAALLRTFIAHAGNEPLAARAGLDAAFALDRLQRQEEAAAVYREVAERFGGTAFAAEARSQLGGAAPPGPG